MERIEPSNGVKMPAMNFGVYRITDPAECEAAVLSAIKAGWRGIDTAASYLNEKAVGRAVASSGIPRSELFISTKLWVRDASEAGAERAIRRSLELLRTDTIDLYLIHQPYGDIYGAWRTMERFYEAGALRAIGVSNFQPDRITDFALHQRIRPTVNQIEVNPFCQQREADAVNRALGVMPSAWAPFAEGRDGLLENPVLREIAADRGATVAQVALAWLAERGIISISKTVSPARMAENLAAPNVKLTPEDMAKIATLDTGTSRFFSHLDPKIVEWLGTRRLPSEP